MAKLINNLRRLIEAKQDEIERRTGKRPTQADIASDMQIASSTLSAYIMGKRSQIHLDTWKAMSDYFGVRGSEIFEIEPEGDTAA